MLKGFLYREHSEMGRQAGNIIDVPKKSHTAFVTAKENHGKLMTPTSTRFRQD